ncbi:MAG: nuclear transport factor 2 family protein [Solirubrobacterales bacterium]
MSQENVEKVRRGFAEYNRGDVEGALQEWAPDAVWDWSNGHGFDAGVYRGRDEIRAFWQQRSAAWEEDRLEIVDLVEVGDDRVIVENVAYLRGRDGIEVEARSAWLVTFQDGEQISLTLFQTMREALEAAGPSE